MDRSSRLVTIAHCPSSVVRRPRRRPSTRVPTTTSRKLEWQRAPAKLPGQDSALSKWLCYAKGATHFARQRRSISDPLLSPPRCRWLRETGTVQYECFYFLVFGGGGIFLSDHLIIVLARSLFPAVSSTTSEFEPSLAESD